MHAAKQQKVLNTDWSNPDSFHSKTAEGEGFGENKLYHNDREDVTELTSYQFKKIILDCNRKSKQQT